VALLPTPAGFETFGHLKWNYALSLPKGFALDQGSLSNDEPLTSFRGGTPATVVRVLVTPVTQTTLAEALAARDAVSAHAWESQPSIAVQSSSGVTVAGLSGIERRESQLAAGFDVEAAYVLHAGRLYRFSTEPYDSETLLPAQIDLHHQIVKTIQFL
jgi:hypothetical protein